MKATRNEYREYPQDQEYLAGGEYLADGEYLPDEEYLAEEYLTKSSRFSHETPRIVS